MSMASRRRRWIRMAFIALGVRVIIFFATTACRTLLAFDLTSLRVRMPNYSRGGVTATGERATSVGGMASTLAQPPGRN
jgi:hypothetical protein